MKTIINRCLATIALIIAGAAASTASVMEKSVYTYSEQAGLKLSKYEVPNEKSALRPCIVFAFGGGFTHGDRDDERYQEYFRFMAEQGYVVCSIDYRTTLAGFKPTTTGIASFRQFGEALVGAVTAATQDFLTATGYILANAQVWGIDPTKIVASGSSAGAISALQAEYMIATKAAGVLPAGFNYAATVTFAGAILSEGEPAGLGEFCSVMLFHGDADCNVPYSSLTLGKLGLYGSEYIAGQLKKDGRSGAFVTELGLDHAMAITPMTQNLYDIAGFLYHVLNKRGPEFDTTVITIPGRPTDYKKQFSIADFIKANMQ